jgi:hypothetical protein
MVLKHVKKGAFLLIYFFTIQELPEEDDILLTGHHVNHR